MVVTTQNQHKLFLTLTHLTVITRITSTITPTEVFITTIDTCTIMLTRIRTAFIYIWKKILMHTIPMSLNGSQLTNLK